MIHEEDADELQLSRVVREFDRIRDELEEVYAPGRLDQTLEHADIIAALLVVAHEFGKLTQEYRDLAGVINPPSTNQHKP